MRAVLPQGSGECVQPTALNNNALPHRLIGPTIVHRLRRRGGGSGAVALPQKSGKKFHVKYHVKFGHFVNFSYTYFR